MQVPAAPAPAGAANGLHPRRGPGRPLRLPAVPALADDRPIRIRDDAAHGHVPVLRAAGQDEGAAHIIF